MCEKIESLELNLKILAEKKSKILKDMELYKNSTKWLYSEYLCLDEELNELNRAEFDYYWNVKAYNINWKTYNKSKAQEISDRMLEIEKIIKERHWLWNYFLFLHFRSFFRKKIIEKNKN